MTFSISCKRDFSDPISCACCSISCLFFDQFKCDFLDQLSVFHSVVSGTFTISRLFFSISCKRIFFDQLCLLFAQFSVFRSVVGGIFSFRCACHSISWRQRIVTPVCIMSLPSEWPIFLNLVDDLLNECESRISGQDYRVFEGLLERLQSACNGCTLPTR